MEHLEARSTSSLLFEITGGDEYNMFQVNPSTGVITTKYPLDYEKTNMYNLTVTATNMVITWGIQIIDSVACFTVHRSFDKKVVLFRAKSHILYSVPIITFYPSLIHLQL